MYNGNKINELLKERNIRKARLIECLNVNSSGLSHIIHGNPTVAKLEPVADFFNVSIDIFFVRNRDVNGTSVPKNEKKEKDIKL